MNTVILPKVGNNRN